ncbi:MAG TPA: galactokinase [Streptosporangiaceae bacterium]|nr:galactokinase [Streptosporangiaceae bacterium]
MTGPGSPRTRGEAAAGWFRDCYGHDPDGVWHAPGRVNLIGEHTDYNDGWVLPFALGQGVRAAAARRDGGMLELHSRQAPDQGVRVAVGSLVPGAVRGWAAFAAGVAWSLREAGHDVAGARIAFDSDLPPGAGLSSSAALACAAAMALAGLYGLDIPRPDLASAARRAENEFAGIPCGVMDQSASLRCLRGHALLLDCRSLEASQIPFDPAASGLELLVLDTKARHEHAESGYAGRRRACERAAALLGVPALRDVAAPAAAERGLADPLLRRRARHVITENQRVHATVALLRAGSPAAIGPLLTASHRSLRDDFEVSWPQADAAVEAALAAGALGARMMGGGFGGSVIALVPSSRAAGLVAAVRDEFRRRGWPEPGVVPASPQAGACLMP